MLQSATGETGPLDPIEHLGVRLERQRRQCFREEEQLTLTGTEFRLLEYLLREPGRTFTRSQLSAGAIGGGAVVLERTIDVHICSLRRKLRSADLIETVRGIGYRFRAAPADATHP